MGGQGVSTRTVICNGCRRDWQLVEPWGESVDPRLYICPDCRKPSRAQLGLLGPVEPAGIDDEYRPDMATVGF